MPKNLKKNNKRTKSPKPINHYMDSQQQQQLLLLQLLLLLLLLLHTHTFNGPLSRTTQVSWHQKGKTNLDFTEARDSEWQWHQLGHMQVCSRQITMPATGPSVFFIDRMPFLLPNQKRQSTEGNHNNYYTTIIPV